MKKRHIITILSLILVISTLSVNGFEGGDGSTNNPYQISTCTQLQNISNNLTANYKLINHINCSNTKNWNNGNGFSLLTPFSGYFNGNGYTIDQLYIDRANTREVGLFAKIDNGKVENVGVTNANITGDDIVGGVAGRNYNGLINSSYSTGNIKGLGSSVGGLVGHNYQGRVTNSYSHANASTGGSYPGGLVGNNYKGTINSSYSTGFVSGSSAGGLVGVNRGGSDNFWDINTSNQTSSPVGTGLTTNEMQNVTTFTKTSNSSLNKPWDFVGDQNNDTQNADIWIMPNTGYPKLSVFTDIPVASSFPTSTGSTNFQEVENLTQVPNMTLATSSSKVNWKNNINAKNQNYDKNIKLDQGLVSINSTALDSSINSSATVNLDISSCTSFDIYKSNKPVDSLSELKSKGTIVGDETGCSNNYCSNVSCSNGELTYDVQHFSSTGSDSTSTNNTETVPEFSTYTLLLAVAITILGFYTIRK